MGIGSGCHMVWLQVWERRGVGWAVCQTHLIIYWVREAEEQKWALEKLLL